MDALENPKERTRLFWIGNDLKSLSSSGWGITNTFIQRDVLLEIYLSLPSFGSILNHDLSFIFVSALLFSSSQSNHEGKPQVLKRTLSVWDLIAYGLASVSTHTTTTTTTTPWLTRRVLSSSERIIRIMGMITIFNLFSLSIDAWYRYFCYGRRGG